MNETQNDAKRTCDNSTADDELPVITETGRDTIRFSNGASVTFEHLPQGGVWQNHVMPFEKPWAGEIIDVDTIVDAREAFLDAYDEAESIDDLPFADLQFVLRLETRN
jgi:hypothetical protein